MKAADSLLPYAPEEQVTGTIRLWGHGSPKHDFMGRLVLRWDQEFHRYQPHVAIVNDMYGTASAVGALYTGAGDLAILGEEVSPAAERAFRRERHYPPTIFEVRTGHTAPGPDLSARQSEPEWPNRLPMRIRPMIVSEMFRVPSRPKMTAAAGR